MLKFLFYFFLAYMLYKLVFDFIIPVYRTTRRVKKEFREMSERMREQQEGYQNYGQQTAAKQSASAVNRPSDKGDYIDFEEVKD